MQGSPLGTTPLPLMCVARARVCVWTLTPSEHTHLSRSERTVKNVEKSTAIHHTNDGLLFIGSERGFRAATCFRASEKRSEDGVGAYGER